MNKSTYFHIVCCLLISFLFSCNNTNQEQEKHKITLEELTISKVKKAFLAGDYTAEELVKAYLNRIEKLDQSSGLNSMVILNPNAIKEARALDKEYTKTGVLRPLHGVPMIVKDNFHTKGLQTTAGSITLKGFISDVDAYQVAKLKEAGAIILGKSNMAEWAFSAKHTNSSIAGMTRNPYNMDYVPAGSSGGTAAAIASNFGLIGLGSDTGNSIRGPSSHNNLVGFRSTLGLTSRYGIVPLILRNDVGGPICRTVEDATQVLNIIAGYDPNDPITKYSEGKVEYYTPYLKRGGLKNARIGVLRKVTDEGIDFEVEALFNQALKDMTAAGATIIDHLLIPDFDTLKQDQWCAQFKMDIAAHLQAFMKIDSLQTLADIIKIGHATPYGTNRLQFFFEHTGRFGDKSVACEDAYTDEKRVAFRKAIEDEMNRQNIDVLVYPSWNFPPALIEAYAEGYKGDNSQVIAPHTGQPAFNIPMGFTKNNLPVGLQLLGRMFDEGKLIKIAYDYEQVTGHRKAAVLGK